jgi:plasmid stabilization system protein ParE
MTYVVSLTPEAQQNIRDAFTSIKERSPLNAARWLQGIHDQIDTLSTFPHRCGTAPEAEHLDLPLRHLLFKSHRVIFIVDEDV